MNWAGCAFDCADCGVHVYAAAHMAEGVPSWCGVCNMLRTVPDLDRAQLAALLFGDDDKAFAHWRARAGVAAWQGVTGLGEVGHGGAGRGG